MHALPTPPPLHAALRPSWPTEEDAVDGDVCPRCHEHAGALQRRAGLAPCPEQEPQQRDQERGFARPKGPVHEADGRRRLHVA